MTGLDPIETRLLDDFQRGFPLCPQPFGKIAGEIGLTETEVLQRLDRLMEGGLVSRVGATVRPNLAGVSTLAAMAVPDDLLDQVAALVGAEPGVNHSYLREDDWNLWFVLAAPDEAALLARLAHLEATSGLRVLDLRLEQAFNIDLGFSLRGKTAMPLAREAVEPAVLDETDRALLAILSRQGMALVPRPYAALSRAVGVTEEAVLSRLSRLVDARVITRLGVIVRHRPLGFTANAMVVWDLPPARIEAAGRALAANPGVTLCYRRRTVPGVWPFALYSMIHARSRPEALAVLQAARNLPDLAGAVSKPLFSTRCFKQTGALIGAAA